MPTRESYYDIYRPEDEMTLSYMQNASNTHTRDRVSRFHATPCLGKMMIIFATFIAVRLQMAGCEEKHAPHMPPPWAEPSFRSAAAHYSTLQLS